MENSNQDKNRLHYEKLYQNYPISNILYWINNLESFLDKAITTETSWNSLYQGNLKERLIGKKVLEMGCGDCVNAAVMAALGAEVYANDIASVSGEIINEVNANYTFKIPIKFIEGDFLKNDLENNQFDFIIGKAFLHHLTIPEEREFLRETARLLKSNGEARFFEPAVNSKILDEIRWHVPVEGRPSKFNKVDFAKWKENDPHPDRSFSSSHFIMAGKEFFNESEIITVGALERFSRLFSWGELRNKYKRWALRNEGKLPFNRTFARGQLIIYKMPVNNSLDHHKKNKI